MYCRGSTEPVHCLNIYNTELISGSTANRIGVHTSIDVDASFSSTKLRSDAFKGLLTSMVLLPLNRLLLLGADTGSISLLCWFIQGFLHDLKYIFSRRFSVNSETSMMSIFNTLLLFFLNFVFIVLISIDIFIFLTCCPSLQFHILLFN